MLREIEAHSFSFSVTRSGTNTFTNFQDRGGCITPLNTHAATTAIV